MTRCDVKPAHGHSPSHSSRALRGLPEAEQDSAQDDTPGEAT
ncbi:hypothetical protein FM103_06150 [Corynebacterium xerosis]|nr:hypothetical protein FM103_06150 [Corynebacterium xerosis]